MFEVKNSKVYNRLLFDEVSRQSKFTSQYLVQLILSTVITTLGLLDDNNIVVIGAMLLSPLFWPVTGVALGIITTKRNMLKNSVISLIVSTLLVLMVSAAITSVVPPNVISSEIQTRINPDLMDLFVALSVSVMGVLALYFPSISSSATGVAISISLLPPLCVSGVGMAYFTGKIVFKSFLLYSTNVGAIIFVGVLIFYLLGVRPQKFVEKKRFRIGVVLSGVLMLLLSMPLSVYLKETVKQNSISNSVTKTLVQEMKLIDEKSKVENVNVEFSVEKINISVLVYLSEDVAMTEKNKEYLLDRLQNITESEVSLDMSLINIVSLQPEAETKRVALKRDVQTFVNSWVKYLNTSAKIESTKITFSTDKDGAVVQVDILLTLRVYEDSPIRFSYVEELTKALEIEFGYSFNVEVELIPVSKLMEPNLETTI